MAVASTSQDSILQIVDLIKTGDINEVKSFIYSRGLMETLPFLRDDHGHLLIHWAALHGHVTVVRWLISCRVPHCEGSQHPLGHHPIHWACINNHISVIDYLLEQGECIDCRDNTGATALIIAAQYGHLLSCAFLISRGALLDACTFEGDTALHLAAHGGHADLCRVLVYSGLSPHQTDNFGQSVLHLAITGAAEERTVQDLCRVDQIDIHLKDNKGRTALDLAKSRHLAMICDILQSEMDTKTNFSSLFQWKSILYGPNDSSKCAVIFIHSVALFCAYPLYFWKILPLTFYEQPVLHVLFMMLQFIGWFSFYHAGSVDPGFLPRNTRQYDTILKNICFQGNSRQGEGEGRGDSSNLNHSNLKKLCHTCRTVKPIRSSHCRYCNRCVRFFDHHCPYISNCVGLNNRHSFLIFVTCLHIGWFVSTYLLLCIWKKEDWIWRWDYFLAVILLIFYSVLVFYISISMWSNAISYLSSYEVRRWRQYEYFTRGRTRGFINPFSRSTWKNLLMYFHLSATFTDDLISLSNVQSY